MLIKEIPDRTRGRYQINVDNTELSAWGHNPRCYMWEHVLGYERPIETEKQRGNARTLLFGQVLHAWLEGYYNDEVDNSWEDYLPELREMQDLDWRSPERVIEVVNAYAEDKDRAERDRYWKVLRLEEYYSKPIGSALEYGGKGDMIVLDTRDNTVWYVDHKTTSKNVEGSHFYDWFNYSYQVTGYHWLGEYVLDLLKETGEAPGDAEFGGVIINAIQSTKTIPFRTKSIPFRRTTDQVEEFVRNAYLVGENILRARDKARTYIEKGVPAESAFPHWPGFSETWCAWRDVNNAASVGVRDNLLSTLSIAPWWERRETEDI